jgi:hypothetical protein
LATLQGADIGRFALDEQGALMRVANVVHHRGIAQPAIGGRTGRGQVHAAPCQGGKTLIEQDPRPPKLVSAPCPRSFGIGPAHGEVNRDDKFTIANDDSHEHAINA